jgi:hypothetical protein
MTRFLLFLSLVGAALYTLLIFTHDALTDGKAENTYAGQTQPNQPAKHLSSWDTYLPDRSVSQNSQLATSQLSPSLTPRQSDEPSQNSERNADQLATSENKATSSGSTEPKPVELAKVVLAALRPITTETIVMPLARRKTMLAGVVSHLPHHQFSLLS